MSFPPRRVWSGHQGPGLRPLPQGGSSNPGTKCLATGGSLFSTPSLGSHRAGAWLPLFPHGREEGGRKPGRGERHWHAEDQFYFRGDKGGGNWVVWSVELCPFTKAPCGVGLLGESSQTKASSRLAGSAWQPGQRPQVPPKGVWQFLMMWFPGVTGLCKTALPEAVVCYGLLREFLLA